MVTFNNIWPCHSFWNRRKFFRSVNLHGKDETTTEGNSILYPNTGSFDLLLCVLTATLVIGNYLPYIGIFNDVLCKVAYFLIAFALMTPNALLLTIAIQIYLKVCRPLGKQMNLFWRRFATVLVITTYIILDVPMLFISGATNSTNADNGMNISNTPPIPAIRQTIIRPSNLFIFQLCLL